MKGTNMVTYRMHKKLKIKKKKKKRTLATNKAGSQNLLSHVTTDLGLC